MEMLRRVLGKAPVEDAEWIASLESSLECHLDSDAGESPLIEFLTPREREAVVRRNQAGILREAKLAGRSIARAAISDLYLVSGLPRGLARDLFRMEGCRSVRGKRQIAVATMRFRADGLPQNVSILATPEGKNCERIATALFTMSLAPDESVGTEQRMTSLAVYDAGSTECGEEGFGTGGAAGPSSDVLRVRARVKAPELLQKIEPLYPETARKNDEEGVNVYEAIISSTGCVREVRLVRGSTPLLDVAGMEAIARWKYLPARLDGNPVRVYLTVTVTFSLNKKR